MPATVDRVFHVEDGKELDQARPMSSGREVGASANKVRVEWASISNDWRETAKDLVRKIQNKNFAGMFN